MCITIALLHEHSPPVYFNSFDARRWQTTVEDGRRWQKMVVDGRRWQTTVEDSRRWQKTVEDCRRRQKMVDDGRRWQTTGEDSRRRQKMVEDGRRRYKMVEDHGGRRLVILANYKTHTGAQLPTRNLRSCVTLTKNEKFKDIQICNKKNLPMLGVDLKQVNIN